MDILLHILATCVLFCNQDKNGLNGKRDFCSKLRRSDLSQGHQCVIFTERNQCFKPVRISCVSQEVNSVDLSREKLVLKIALVRNRLSSHLFLRVIIQSFWGDSEYTWHHPDEEKELCDNTANVKLCVKWKVYCLGFIFLLAFFILKCQSLT